MTKDWMPSVAGVLEIVAAVCAFMGAAALAFSCAMVSTVPDIQNDPDVPFHLIRGLLGGLAAGLGVLGLVALVGGICALRRRGWGGAVAGAIASLFAMPPFGVIAIVLVMIGEGEFEGGRRARGG